MKSLFHGALAALLAGAPVVSSAQSNLGELLDQGGKKLTRDELTAVVSDSTASGATADGNESRLEYKADGTVTGSLALRTGQYAGRNVGLFGKWSADDSGKFCAELRSTGGNTTRSCGFLFKQGDQLFSSESDADRTAAVRKRAFKK